MKFKTIKLPEDNIKEYLCGLIEIGNFFFKWETKNIHHKGKDLH